MDIQDGKKTSEMLSISPSELQKYEKKIYDLEQLIDFSKLLNSSLSYENIIDVILDMCLTQLKTTKLAFFLPKRDNSSTYFLMGENYRGIQLQSKYEYKIDLSLVLEEGLLKKPRIVSAQLIGRQKKNKALLKHLIKMEICFFFPFIAKEQIMGIMGIGERWSSSGYKKDEIYFLKTMALLGGLSLEHARLYRRATTDLKTGLKNYTFFIGSLVDQIEGSIEGSSSLSLMIIDLDHFKKVNDNYGHQAGDMVLCSVADLLKKHTEKLSPFAVACRFGGEEFCLSFSKTKREDACAIAESIRKEVKALKPKK